MSLSRRRFIALSASAMALPTRAVATRWEGRAFGAEISVDLSGDGARITRDLEDVLARLHEIEARFSIYSKASEVSRLNARGAQAASVEMLDLLDLTRRVNHATGGAFDPSVQVLWEALAEGRDPTAARALVGFDKVRIDKGRVTLVAGQKLTFNGIAQGYASDLIRMLLAERGYTRALVNIGEYAALGGPFRIGVEDVSSGRLGAVTLMGNALATSSPNAMQVGGGGHILSPWNGDVLWSSVTVEAPSAALADACSTAFCLMDRAQIKQAKHVLGLSRVYVVDEGGDLSVI